MATTEIRGTTLAWTRSAGRSSLLRTRARRIVALAVLGTLTCFALLQTVSTASLQQSIEIPGSRFSGTADSRSATGVHHNIRTPGDEIAAAIAWLDSLELRRIVICRSDGIALPPDIGAQIRIVSRRCDGSTGDVASTARDIAGGDAQAIVFDGTTRDAVVFIEALRAKGNFAMVVVGTSVDAGQLVRMIQPSARTWLAAEQIVDAGSGAAKAVRIGLLTPRGTILR